MIDASDLSLAISIVMRFGRASIIVENGKLAMVVEGSEPFGLTSAEMGVLQQLGWLWNGWTDRFEKEVDNG
jgi:hypothetical protein